LNIEDNVEKNSLIPFKILFEKIPFLEFLARNIRFILKSNIECTSIRDSDLKFAFWDVFLALSLAVTVIFLMAIFNPSIDPEKYLPIFTSNLGAFLTFLLDAYISIAAFFVIIFVVSNILSYRSFVGWKKPFIATLQFARWYGVFIFIFIPIFVWGFDKMISDLISYEYIADLYFWQIVGFIFLMICLTLKVLVLPLNRYLPLSSNRIISFFLTLVIIMVSFDSSNFLPQLHFSEINKSVITKLIDESKKNKNCPVDVS
jgi:hypothetical protein